jgi:predicted RNase H-like nuclease (RuvC/YqgF family)
VSLDGIRATPGQVKFIPPWETPKRPTPPLEREEKRPRMTIAMLETRMDHMSQTITSLQQQNTFLIRTVDTLNKKVELESKERKNLEKQIEFFSDYVGKKRELRVSD